MSWGRHAIDLAAHPQLPLQVGRRIAALAIMDGRVKRSLQWSASHDPLTSLTNRSEFSRRLGEMVASNVTMFYVDLDDFKPVNDTFGHQVGDAVLAEVAARLRRTVGRRGICSRLGGDEFAIACEAMADLSEGWALAETLVRTIREPIHLGRLTLRVGASVGVAMGVQPLIPTGPPSMRRVSDVGARVGPDRTPASVAGLRVGETLQMIGRADVG